MPKDRRSRRNHQDRAMTLIKIQITVAILVGVTNLVELANTMLHLL
jgi:hypothetical protein